MARIILYFIFSLIACVRSFGQTDNSSLIDINYQKLISRADLVYDQPVSRSEEGMPVGNGVMGSLVWTTPSALHFQLNRTDVFGNNSASNSFYERHTDYCGGIGFVDVEFGHEFKDIFAAGDFQQHLSVYDGVVTVKGKGVTAKILTWHDEDVMAIQIQDSGIDPMPILTHLRTLRQPEVRKGSHQALSAVKVIDNRIVLTQQFKEDDYYNGSAIVIEVTERTGKAGIANASSARISAVPGKGNLTILMASAASFDPKDDLVAAATEKLEAAKIKGFDGLLKSNQEWWQNFWKKSFIHLHSDDGKADMVEKYYSYYLYIMASSSRGRYPTKFNGMLWTTGGDERKWGNLYWGANQSCLYNGLFMTNHFELLDPMFNMYSQAYNTFAAAAQQQWGSKGIFIPEVVAFDGLAPVPNDIAAEMRELYLMKKPWAERSQRFNDYSYTKMPFLARWNWKKDDGWENGVWNITDKGGGVFGHVTHIFSRGAKIAYQYWLRYEYTQDKEWLRNQAYPMLKGMAEFYRNFPNVKKEQDGKYHIYHVNDNESVWGGHNTVEEISSMMAIFPAAIRAAEILNVDPDLRASWKEFRDNLSPLALSTDTGKSEPGKPVRWIRSLQPMVQGNGERNPDSNTMPVWFFDLCTLEADKKVLDIANATYNAYFSSGISEKTNVYVLSRLPIAGAVLGREDATRYLIPNQINTGEIKPLANRLDLREGEQTTSVQRLGRAAEALQLALCQSVPAAPGEKTIIRVFPAWPKDWDAQYTLLCRGGFLVTSSMKKGTIEFVEILSQGGAECRIRNPWPGQEVSVSLNGKRISSGKSDLLTFPTEKNARFVLTRKSDKPDQFKQTVLPQ